MKTTTTTTTMKKKMAGRRHRHYHPQSPPQKASRKRWIDLDGAVLQNAGWEMDLHPQTLVGSASQDQSVLRGQT